MRSVSVGKVLALVLTLGFSWATPTFAKSQTPNSIEALLKRFGDRDAIDARCQDEVTWLACGIYFEARGETLEGQYKMALSILARVKDRRWPNTIEKVVRQGEGRRNRCQYSFRCDGKPDRVTEENAWTNALFVAQVALGKKRLGCAHSYHADYVTSKGALAYFTTLASHEKVGRHIFFCDKQKK